MVPENVCHGPRCSLSGLDQRPPGIAPDAGVVGWQGLPSASQWSAVVCCYQSRGRPRCASVWGVNGPLALVHRCRGPVSSGCGVHGPSAPVHRCVSPASGVCGVIGLLALVHRCPCPMCGVFGVPRVFALVHRFARFSFFLSVSLACWHLFTLMHAQLVSCMRCPSPLHPCSPL